MKLFELPQPLPQFIQEVHPEIQDVAGVDLQFSDNLPYDWFPLSRKTAITLGRTIYFKSQWLDRLVSHDDQAVALLLHELRHVWQQQGKSPLLWRVGYLFNRLFGGRTLEKDADSSMREKLPVWRHHVGSDNQTVYEFG